MKSGQPSRGKEVNVTGNFCVSHVSLCNDSSDILVSNQVRVG